MVPRIIYSLAECPADRSPGGVVQGVCTSAAGLHIYKDRKFYLLPLKKGNCHGCLLHSFHLIYGL